MPLSPRITFEVSALEETDNGLSSHFEIKLSEPINGQWLYAAIRMKLDEAMRLKGGFLDL